MKAKPTSSVSATSFDVSGGPILDVPVLDPVTVTIWLVNSTGENLQFQYENSANGCSTSGSAFCGPLLSANNCTTHLYDPMPCNSTTVSYGLVRIKSPTGRQLKVHGDMLANYQFGGNAPRNIWKYTISWQ